MAPMGERQTSPETIKTTGRFVVNETIPGAEYSPELAMPEAAIAQLPDWQERQHAKAEAMGTLLTPMAAFEFPVPGWAGPVTDEKEHQP